MSTTRNRHRWLAFVASLAAVAAVLVPTAEAAPADADDLAQMRTMLSALRNQHNSLGAAITFGDGSDDVTLSSGTGRVLANQPIRADAKVRVGSQTKTVVATVVLQLVDEDVLDLDVPVEEYVPGVFRYPSGTTPGDPAAYDGRTVTLRQLLQHTAGIADYADLQYAMNPLHSIFVPTPRQHLDYGLDKGPTHAPGTAWSYSNSHYALIGMILEATTGRSVGTEIRDRITEPLGLTDTFFAEPGQRSLPGRHVRGYINNVLPVDLTNWEPAVWGTAGALVSTADDMNTFYDALLRGDLLPPELMAEMFDTTPMDASAHYGLGVVRVPLSCGTATGHSGFVAGYNTFGLAMDDGRHAFVTLNTSIPLSTVVPQVVALLYTLLPLGEPVTAIELIEDALCP